MLKRALCGLLGLYQKYIRITLPSSCRFSPSCSEYARLAIKKYGATKGAWKAAKRLMCCHPFSQKSGFDPLR